MTNPTAGLKITTSGDLDIIMERNFQAPRALVFDAWTNCEHLKRWWGPRTWSLDECEIDLRVGGKWRYFMRGQEPDSPFRNPSTDREEMGMYGEYRVIERPVRLVQTENFEGGLFEPMGGGSLNTLLLEERDGITTMTITSRYKSKEARDSVLQFPMEEGAEESFQRLDELLEALARR
jgi:uncharacterized protein YndB with AHSA1/START domain